MNVADWIRKRDELIAQKERTRSFVDLDNLCSEYLGLKEKMPRELSVDEISKYNRELTIFQADVFLAKTDEDCRQIYADWTEDDRSILKKLSRGLIANTQKYLFKADQETLGIEMGINVPIAIMIPLAFTAINPLLYYFIIAALASTSYMIGCTIGGCGERKPTVKDALHASYLQREFLQSLMRDLSKEEFFSFLAMELHSADEMLKDLARDSSVREAYNAGVLAAYCAGVDAIAQFASGCMGYVGSTLRWIGLGKLVDTFGAGTGSSLLLVGAKKQVISGGRCRFLSPLLAKFPGPEELVSRFSSNGAREVLADIRAELESKKELKSDLGCKLAALS